MFGASGWDRVLAGVCVRCPVCNRARKRRGGIAFIVVKAVERRFCPFCRAYERVYKRRAHERPPPFENAE
ncbi:MAG: hypothetical protein K9N52_10025 [Verrucomicrobia bacterium]|nr:hypothetical protein [Verrucomicrobiota bacterium]